MAVFVPDLDNPIPAADIIDDWGAALAEQYSEAEDALIRAIALRSYRDLQLQARLAQAKLTADEARTITAVIARNRALAELQGYRAQALRELQFLAVETADKIRRAGLAEQVIDIAASEGEQAAVARLKMARRLPAGPLTGTATQAVASLTLDLQSRLEELNKRITRFPRDAYQRVISMTAPNVILGAATNLGAQQLAVQRFLSEGITGFVDKADRRWKIGTYAEMASRTAVARAYNDAGIWRMQQVGVNLVTITGALDACSKCAPWIGKILSTDGTTGEVSLPHATRDEQVTVIVAGTLDQARSSGYGHPNDRCKVTTYLPGLSIPQAGFEYSPEREAQRVKQREIEVGIRKAKRAESVAGDDISRRRAQRDVREGQTAMREHLAQTGRKRASFREQLHFADGSGKPPHTYGAMNTPTAPQPLSAPAKHGIDIRIKSSTQLGKDVRGARLSIAKVHSIPADLPYLPVTSARLRAGERGVYKGSTSELHMSAAGVTPRLTFAHETGHYLDHVALGSKTNNFESRQLTDPRTSEWLTAVNESAAVKRLKAMRAEPAFAAFHEHIDYLTQPVELWGRSYAQWIATKSKDTAMLAETASMLASPDEWTAHRQWSKKDFESISPTLDAIFKAKGMLR